uniref:Glycoside hydrolase family 5 domain-containing protein n=1 Tax=Globisporangium ultimum (strain ATCC 200006 / CBS 805.95 / DAOM BR144) TaxID=431595 RepID=K3WCX1_GLOUD
MARYSHEDVNIDDELVDAQEGLPYSPSLIASSEMLDSSPTVKFSRAESSNIDETDYYVGVGGGVPYYPLPPPPISGGSNDPRRSSFEYSQPHVSFANSVHNGSESGANNASRPFTRGSMLMDRDIEALTVSPSGKKERKRDYKGRYRTWPGLVLLVLLLGAAGFGITYFAVDTRSTSQSRQQEYAIRKFKNGGVKGGDSTSSGDTEIGDELIADDGVIGNPKKYPTSACELPDYQSKNGKIFAVSKNGTEVPIAIKGLNWFGMETGQAIPFGLWDNTENGTTAYQIASFIANNKFNAVRLPLMAAWILDNKIPNGALINKQENRAISVKDYMSLLKSIIKVLQFRKIGVLISMHTLEYNDNGFLWYNDNITEEKFLEAIDILTSNLCDQEYWNIMGIDLKNEPYKGTWGDDSPTDFRAGSQRIANRMLKGCSNWMGFVEGVNGQRSVTIDGEAFAYYDWYGGGLQGAKTAPVEFAVKNKVVYAPHYYTPAVYPQKYFYGAGFTELDDDALRVRIKGTMDDMFGFLAGETGPALLLGEFGGLYEKDAHPRETTKRCTDFSIEIIKKPGWAGGFVWSLNPESAYGYNPKDTAGTFTEGLLEDDWLRANEPFMKAMKAMNDMEDLKLFPCFPTTAEEKEDA